MGWWSRFKRLSPWAKLGVVGSIASLGGLGLAYWPPSSTMLDKIGVRNETHGINFGSISQRAAGHCEQPVVTHDRATYAITSIGNVVNDLSQNVMALWTNLAQIRMHPSKTNPTKLVASLSYRVAMRRCSLRCPMKHSIRDRSA